MVRGVLAWEYATRRLSDLLRPGRQLERALEGGAIVHRLAVRDDHVLERQVEQRAEGLQRTLLVRRRPDAEPAVGRGERVGEDGRALLGEPGAGLLAAAAVVQRHQ